MEDKIYYLAEIFIDFWLLIFLRDYDIDEEDALCLVFQRANDIFGDGINDR